MANLISELIIKLKDDVSARAKPIEAALEGIAKGEKAVGAASADMKKLTAELERSKTGLSALDKLKTGMKGLSDTRSAFNSAQENVRKLAVEIANTDKPTRAMTAAFKAAQREVKTASEAMRAQAAATKEAKAAIAGFDIALTTVSSAEAKLKSSIEQTVNAIREQERAEISAARASEVRAMRQVQAQKTALAAAEAAVLKEKELASRRAAFRENLMSVAPFVGPALLHETGQAINAGANYEQQIAQMKAAGMSPAEIAEAQRTADTTTKRFPGLKKEEILESYKEARSVMQDPHEAAMATSVIAEAKAALRATGHFHEADQVNKLVKAAELLGRTKDEKGFRDYINAQVRAGQTMGGTITPEDQYEVAKYARNAGARLSDRFMSTTAQSMTQELGGSTTGTLIRDFYQHVIGGHMTHQGYKNLLAAGLIDKKDVLNTKTGEIKGLKPGRHIQDYQTAMTDPDQWVYKVNDRLKAKGMKDEDIQAWWSQSFDSGTADFAVKLTTQRKAFENHAQMYDKAMGLDAYKLSAENLNAATESLKAAIENFAATLTHDTTKKIATGETIGVSGINIGTKFLEDHPLLTKILGPAVTAGSLYVGGKLSLKALLGVGRFVTGTATGTAVTAATARAAATGAAEGAAATAASRMAGTSLLGGLLRGLSGPVGVGATALSVLNAMQYGPDGKHAPGSEWSPEGMRRAFDGKKPGDLGPAAMWGMPEAKTAPVASELKVPDIKPSGQDAGVQTGQNIADGIASQESAIIAAAERIMAAITAALSKGVDVPIRLQQQGASTVTGTHADYGIDYSFGD